MDTPEALGRRTLYTYSPPPRTGSAEIRLLARVQHQILRDGSVDTVDSESYKYTDQSYLRTDVPREEGHLSPGYIIYSYSDEDGNVFPGRKMYFLRHATNHAGEFIVGHQYNRYGMGVTNEEPGAFTRLAYFEEPTGQKTVVTNESTGARPVEYTVVGDRIEAMVMIDGRRVGTTPIVGRCVSAGVHEIVVESSLGQTRRFLKEFGEGDYMLLSNDTNWESATFEKVGE